MLSWVKRIAATLAMLALPCLVSLAAPADSVSYHTVVTFTAAGTGGSLATTTNANDTIIAPGGDKLVAVSESFSGVTAVPLLSGFPMSATFGNFLMVGAPATN